MAREAGDAVDCSDQLLDRVAMAHIGPPKRADDLGLPVGLHFAVAREGRQNAFVAKVL